MTFESCVADQHHPSRGEPEICEDCETHLCMECGVKVPKRYDCCESCGRRIASERVELQEEVDREEAKHAERLGNERELLKQYGFTWEFQGTSTGGAKRFTLRDRDGQVVTKRAALAQIAFWQRTGRA